jgi:transposase-like protein
MRQRTVIRYSMGFKQQVIQQFESGRFGSISEAQEHFGIKSPSTISYWLRKYGRNHLCAKVVRVEKLNEKDQIRELKKQIRQLKEALGQTQAEKIIGEEFLKIACEELDQDVEDFKKKVDIKRFTAQENERS